MAEQQLSASQEAIRQEAIRLKITNGNDPFTEITEVLTAGTDDEVDDNLRDRLAIRVQKQATSGNAYHYEQWALSVPGVGAVKVIPVWDGPNTRLLA